MDEASLLKQVARKNSDPAKIAAKVIAEPGLVAGLMAGLSSAQPDLKYRCEKVLRFVGKLRPDILYPHFDFFVGLLSCENSFLKWGAIRNIANMARIDKENKFESVFDDYFSPIPGPVMITAGNTIGGAATIALAKPKLADRISREILKVEQACYQTPECKNVAIGHAIDAFDRIFDLIRTKAPIIHFIEKQLKNTRPAVRRRAEAFMRKRTRPDRDKPEKC